MQNIAEPLQVEDWKATTEWIKENQKYNYQSSSMKEVLLEMLPEFLLVIIIVAILSVIGIL